MRKKKEEQAEQKRIESLKDSASVFLDYANSNISKYRYKKALLYLDTALSIYNENEEVLLARGDLFVKMKKYADAETEYRVLAKVSPKFKVESYVKRGNCFIKLGKKEKAIKLFLKAKKKGNKDGDKLYEKYNPMVKKIIGYVTRCCDGTTSNAKGSGACSHHGGVCNWNEPVYKESRKYPIE